jgi:hypothetical protein
VLRRLRAGRPSADILPDKTPHHGPSRPDTAQHHARVEPVSVHVPR